MLCNSRYDLDPNNRILIVDDNEAIHADIRKILGNESALSESLQDAKAAFFGAANVVESRANYDIDSAFQGQEALELVRRALGDGRPYAVAFIDGRMPPGWDGIETVRRIWEEYAELQVVICTAYTDYTWEEINEISKSDQLLILKKPFDNIELRQLAFGLTKKWNLAQQASLNLQDLELMVRARTQELESANQQLIDSEVRYRLLAENTTDLISLHSLNGAYQYASPVTRSLLGYEPQEVLGRPLSDFCHPEYVAQLQQSCNAVRGSAESRTISYQIRRKDGTLCWVEMTIQALCNPAVPSSGEMICVTRDISHRKQLESELEQSRKMEAIGCLAGGIAHDFNNLLTVILGYGHLALADAPADDLLRENLQEIIASGERAAQLTSQLLAFGRRQTLDPVVLDLNRLVAGANRLFRPLIGENIELQTDLSEELVLVKADSTQIERILLNLIVNARDAMPAGGPLVIETRNVEFDELAASAHPDLLPGKYAQLTVRDTGCGMDEKTQARIFEPFFTTKGVGKGTGMGLATVYGIVKQSDGFIWVASELQKGTTFTICLPEAMDSAAIPTLTDPARKDTLRHGTETILLVEDEAAVRKLSRRALEVNGYTVLEAAHGQEALAIAAQFDAEIHLLVTDVLMPGLNGRQVADQLVLLRPGLKVLFVSGYPKTTTVCAEVLERGSAFLQKPFTQKTLAGKVREVLQANQQPVGAT